MVNRGYCQLMARYNMWQNSQLHGLLEVMDEEGLQRDRGAFFGSILATLNHILWGDLSWISRLDGGEPNRVGVADSVSLTADLAGWKLARDRLDRRISLWADGVTDAALQGELRYFSGFTGREMHKPMGLCVVQLFNHQTHHRGQVHAMMTAAGLQAPVTDLPFMPAQA